MADFGWAFVRGNLVTGSSPPSGAVQYNDGNNKFAASSDLVFVSGATSQLNLTGNMDVVGDVSASVFYGDGSNLTGISANPGGSDTQIQFNDSNNFGGSANLTFDGSTLNLTGTLNISGTLATNELVVNVENRNVINISATGSTQFGDTTDDTHVFTGSMSISASSNPINLKGLQSGTGIDQSSYLALDSNYNLVLTSAADSSDGGTIGEAEDGTYTDGLFTDFLSSTPIGTAIDRFNEILSIIVPGPAPAVDRIDYTNTSGIETRLSFDSSANAPSGYVDVDSTGSFTSPPSIDDQYTVTTSGEDFRLGVFDGTQQIEGIINFNTTEQLKSTEVNYSTDAFGNAESGSLVLYLNETALRTLDLNGFAGSGNPNTGSATDLNANGSGFFDISVATNARDQNGSEYDIFQHRTAKFRIHPDDQNKGWNYAKVEHQFGSVTYVTNFVQWFNDSDAGIGAAAMSVSNPRITFTGNGSKFLSGVEYFRSASLVYNAEVENAYRNTYPTGNVLTFNRLSNVDSIDAQSLPATDGTDLYNKVFEITGSTETNDDTMLVDSTTISINLTHPLKTNLSSTGSVTADEILIYNQDAANSNTVENFELENYRIQNNAYTSQISVSAPAQAWDSENHMTSSGATGHTDGLMMYNSKLYSPSQAPSSNGGDFASLTNGPSGNPDYSSVTGTRTFYRKLENTTGSPVYDLKITSTKNTKINTDSLSDNDNVKFSVKIPETTGWMVISDNFTYGNIADDDGALINGASDNSNTGITSTSNSVHCITFGTASVAAGDYVVIKIEANAGWTKYFETLQFQLGASDTDNAITPDTLADLNLEDTAGVEAKLSFGADNAISGYSNVAGVGSLSAVNVNGVLTDDGDVSRGVFSAFETMGGTLNPTASTLRDGTQDTFYNGYTGSLVLEVNGGELTTINLESTRNSISSISDGTGLSVSAVGESLTSDNIPDYNLHYRTGTYSVGTGEQNLGWNYARVIHRVGGVDTTTNYVEWVVDTSASVDTAISTATLTDFGHTNTHSQSGIKYFSSNPTASFSFSGSNFYNNVYQNGNAISFPSPSNVTVNTITGSGSGLTTLTTTSTTMAMPALDESADCELTEIVVTASVTYSGGTSISGGLGQFTDRDASITGQIIHPLKTTRTTSDSKTSFMVYSGGGTAPSLTSNEFFSNETYRIVSGNYANQAAVTSSSNTWDSSTQMNNGGTHDDGMVTVNDYLISPLQIGNAGDTRNDAEGSTGLQAPSGNPDYSTLSEDIRTYYRYFYNNTGTNLASITLTLYGDAELVSKEVGDTYYAALGANKNINVEVKSPTKPDDSPDQSTGWGDAARAWTSALQPTPTNDGAGIRDVGGGDEQTITTSGLGIDLTFGNRRISAGSYYVVKISAHKNWTGYISRINIS